MDTNNVLMFKKLVVGIVHYNSKNNQTILVLLDSNLVCGKFNIGYWKGESAQYHVLTSIICIFNDKYKIINI